MLGAPLLGRQLTVSDGSSQFVTLEIFCCWPSWGLEISQGPFVPPWEGKMGRRGEGALGALLSSWEFVSLSLSFFFSLGGIF